MVHWCGAGLVLALAVTVLGAPRPTDRSPALSPTVVGPSASWNHLNDEPYNHLVNRLACGNSDPLTREDFLDLGDLRGHVDDHTELPRKSLEKGRSLLHQNYDVEKGGRLKRPLWSLDAERLNPELTAPTSATDRLVLSNDRHRAYVLALDELHKAYRRARSADAADRNTDSDYDPLYAAIVNVAYAIFSPEEPLPDYDFHAHSTPMQRLELLRHWLSLLNRHMSEALFNPSYLSPDTILYSADSGHVSSRNPSRGTSRSHSPVPSVWDDDHAPPDPASAPLSPITEFPDGELENPEAPGPQNAIGGPLARSYAEFITFLPDDLVDGRLLAVQIFYRELVQVRADALRWLLLLAELRQIQNTLGSVIGENDPYEKHYVHFAEPATQQTPETLKQFFIDASLAARPPFDFFAHLVDTAEDAGMISEAVHAESSARDILQRRNHCRQWVDSLIAVAKAESTHRFHFWDVLDTIFFNNPLFINELMASETASLKFYGALHAKLVEDQFMMKHQLRQQSLHRLDEKRARLQALRAVEKDRSLSDSGSLAVKRWADDISDASRFKKMNLGNRFA